MILQIKALSPKIGDATPRPVSPPPAAPPWICAPALTGT